LKLRQLTIEKKRRREAYYFILPAFFYMLLVLGYPLIYNVVLSFKDVNVKKRFGLCRVSKLHRFIPERYIFIGYA